MQTPEMTITTALTGAEADAGWYRDDDDERDSIDGNALLENMFFHNFLSDAKPPLGAWRMREAERLSNAAGATDVSQLELRRLGREDSKEEGVCAVCQCDWAEGDEARFLPCGHHFHACCVDRWLTQHNACCPLCKTDVRTHWEDLYEETLDAVSGSWSKSSAEGQSEEEESRASARSTRPVRRSRRLARKPAHGMRLKSFKYCRRSTSAAEMRREDGFE